MSQEKVIDILDPNRLSVKKARNSNQIQPLKPREGISISAFPLESQKHLLRIIPKYLEMFYDPVQAAMPPWKHFHTSMMQNEKVTLGNSNPFVAYSITKFHQYHQTTFSSSIKPMLEEIRTYAGKLRNPVSRRYLCVKNNDLL